MENIFYGSDTKVSDLENQFNDLLIDMHLSKPKRENLFGYVDSDLNIHFDKEPITTTFTMILSNPYLVGM